MPTEMNNQAAQTMPELPKSFGEHCVYDSVRVMREPGYTADQMHQYARDYAASLTAGVAEGLTPSLRDQLQQKCSDWGTYWRAPDAHGVILSQDQATELLRDALCVEVEVSDWTPGAWSKLETWLGTYADSIPNEAYHELCAIQKLLNPHPKPEGVVVPADPTPEMVQAICQAHAGKSLWPTAFGGEARTIRQNHAIAGYRAMLAAAPAASGGEESIAWTEKERRAIAEMMTTQEFSYAALMRQAVRLYQHNLMRLKDGETCTWSGDEKRAREFAGMSQPPAAASVSERARELLAQVYDQAGDSHDAAYIRNGGNGTRTNGDVHIRMALRALSRVLAAEDSASPTQESDLLAVIAEAIRNAERHPRQQYGLNLSTLRALEQALTQQRGAEPVPAIVREVLEWYASDPSIWVGWTKEAWAEEEAAKKSGHYRFIGEDNRGHNEYVPNHVRAEEALAAYDEWQERVSTTPQPSADAVRELAATWRKRAERKRFVGLKNEALLDETHADELESLLGRGCHG